VTDDARLKQAYKAASELYRDIVSRNTELTVQGVRPTNEALQREDNARLALELARRAYLVTLPVPVRNDD
jgi:hypothetical protein